MDEAHIRRYIEVLQKLIDARGSSRGTIERNLGWSRGLLTKLFQQKHELKVRHVLSILEALEIEPLLFFTIVHPSAGHEREDLLAKVLHHLDAATQPYTPLSLGATISNEELDRRIQEAVERALANRRHPE